MIIVCFHAAAAERIKKIGENCKKHGLRFLFHNHFCEFDKIDGKAAIDYLFESVDKELLGAQLDTAWVNQVGLNPVDAMEKYSDRNPIVHIKYCIGRKTDICPFGYKDVPENEIPEFSFMPIGQGMINIGDIIEKCRKRNMDWETFRTTEEFNQKLREHLNWSNNKTMRTLGRKSPMQLLKEKLAV